MHIVAVEDLCISSGQCSTVAPDVFDNDEETGVVIVRPGGLTEQTRESAEHAVQLCPVAAIRLTVDQ